MGTSRRVVVLLLAGCLAVAAAAIARADTPDTSGLPNGDTVETFPQQNFPPDTPVNGPSVNGTTISTTVSANNSATPIPKDGNPLWVQVGGAKFPRSSDLSPNLVSGSANSYADNLFDVAFYETQLVNSDFGFAGGATCQQRSDPTDPSSVDPTDTESSDPDHEKNCYPVLYRYSEHIESGHGWEKVDLPGQDRPGYIGAIAWIDKTSAIAVGGTGTYPRREPPYGKDINGNDCAPPAQDSLDAYGANCDQAGTARVWLYRDGHWCELGHDSGCPLPPQGREFPSGGHAPAHGLTAVGFRPQLQPGDPELGFVAGLGQIWRWRAGGFDKLYDNASPDSDLKQQGSNIAPPFFGLDSSTARPGHLFRFRVRDLRFVAFPGTVAYAVTDGCCSPQDTTDEPLTLAYNESNPEGQWFLYRHHVNPLNLPSGDPSGDPNEPVDDVNNTINESVNDVNNTINDVNNATGTKVPGLPSGTNVPGPPATPAPKHQSGLTVPDSFYSLMTYVNFGQPGSSILMTPASTDSEAQQPSQLSGMTGQSGGPTMSATPTLEISTARLLSIDGPSSSVTPLWAVGEVRASAIPGHGRQALVRAQPRSNPADYALASYTLNSIETIGDSTHGWAVGDHGAIMRLDADPSSAGDQGSQSQTPIGDRRVAAPPLTAPYDEHRPSAASDVAAVPSLQSQPSEHLTAPRLVPYGSPDPRDANHQGDGHGLLEDVRQIVMSRDGSEGWAIGPSGDVTRGLPPGAAQTLSLFHYEGGRWSRCDPTGIPHHVAADPTCASLGDLRAQHVSLIAAARVPLERDSDPSNDDDFEVVAIGTLYADDPSFTANNGHARYTIARYRHGRWSLEDSASRNLSTLQTAVNGNAVVPISIAFTAPDDGWILGPSNTAYELAHFDGRRWIDCKVPGSSVVQPECGLADSARMSGWINADNAGGSTGTGVGIVDSVAASVKSGLLGGPDTVVGLVAAGDRVYMYGTRWGSSTDSKAHPLILYHDRGKPCEKIDDPGCWHAEGGGYDPGFSGSNNGSGDEPNGWLRSLSVAQAPDGHYEAWAIGAFGGTLQGPSSTGEVGNPETVALRLEGDAWNKFPDAGVLHDYLGGGDPRTTNLTTHNGADAYPYGTDAAREALVPQAGGSFLPVIGQLQMGRLLAFDQGKQRWRLIDAARPFGPGSGGGNNSFGVDGAIRAVAPDGDGGFWVALRSGNPSFSQQGVPIEFYHYTDHPLKPVFNEVANPLGDSGLRTTGIAGSPDGDLWASTNSGTVYRYTRAGGWDRVNVPGWDPRGTFGAASEAFAVAAGPNGTGLAVGKGGRIADLSPSSVVLDEVAGKLCPKGGPALDCGTRANLRAAAIAPQDGSAIVAGDSLALLWRGPGGQFQPIARPDAPRFPNITAVSMPRPNQAWFTTDSGLLYAGTMSSPGNWSWQLENLDARGDVLNIDPTDLGKLLPLRAVAVNAKGDGYAVGDDGTVLRRQAGADPPWHRVRTGFLDSLTSVALPQGRGEGALAGGHNGIILKLSGDTAELVRAADYFGSEYQELSGTVSSLALLPGDKPGQVEAWAALEGAGRTDKSDNVNRRADNGVDQLLHYTNDPGDALLDPDRERPLADTPPHRQGELSFATFGYTACRPQPSLAFENGKSCPSLGGTTADNEVITQRSIAEIIAASKRAGGPSFSLFTGDALDNAGPPEADKADQVDGSGSPTFAGPVDLRQWVQLVPERLEDGGVPLLGAIGAHDLSSAQVCDPKSKAPRTTCYVSTSHQFGTSVQAGENQTWRDTMASQPAPWGSGATIQPQGLSFSAVDDSASNAVAQDGARTHYAVDVSRGGAKIARLVFADTSLHDLQTSDPIQNPLEANGGQTAWLERMLCIKGDLSAKGTGCTREASQQAIVITNTPTYSYGPGTTTETQANAAAFESVLLQDKANLVVSGRIGWNGLYWALAAGVHYPCPGRSYPAGPPQSASGSLCDQSTSQLPVQPPDPQQILAGTGANLTGMLPFVVASSAGGDLADSTGATEAGGFWHGYTIVRLDPSGDPRKTIVEQRPVLDWVSLAGNKHVLRPGQKAHLQGLGREPVGLSSADKTMSSTSSEIVHTIHFDKIDAPDISHCYDLVLADPDRPWQALLAKDASDEQLAAAGPGCASRSFADVAAGGGSQQTGSNGEGAGASASNPCDPYVCVPAGVGSIDSQTGEVHAGSGGQPRTFAIALLSVGDHVASYPLVFEPRPSFHEAPVIDLPPVPAPTPPPTPPAPPATNPPFNPPPTPTLPALPPLAAQQPLAPPAPPAPPNGGPAQLDLFTSPPVLSVAPSISLFPPAPPVINVAPPTPARPVEKAKKVAVQSSGSDSDAKSGDAAELGGDLANSPESAHGQSMTRHNPNAFTAIAHKDQASAWARDLQWGGGLTLMALVAAFGWITVRPTPRRQRPEIPAAAYSRIRRR
jgi:hypothetical protein